MLHRPESRDKGRPREIGPHEIDPHEIARQSQQEPAVFRGILFALPPSLAVWAVILYLIFGS